MTDQKTRNILMAFIPAIAALAAVTTPAEAADIAALAEAGNDGAQFMLALLYLRGEGGLAADLSRAAKWLRRAAANGNAYAVALLQDWRGRRSRQSAG